MDIKIKELEPCKLQVNYLSDSEELEEKLEQVLQTFKKAPVSGFRKGKAPVHIVKNKYKKQINDSLKRAMLEEAYHNILFEENLSAIGSPEILSADLKKNKFGCEMVLHVKPTFDVKPYNEYTIPKPHVDMTVDDLTEKMLHELRVRYGEVNQYEDDDFVQTGDNLIVNYVGTIDGEVVNSLSAEGEMLTVGASKLVEFDNNLLGMTMGEERVFEITVPEDGLPSLAGKIISFEVVLIAGSKTTPAALDDDLANKLGKSNYTELRSMVSATAGQRVSEMGKAALIESISNILVADYDFVVPNWLVLPEAKQLAVKTKSNWEDLEDLDKEKFLNVAERNVKLSLVLDKIRTEDPDAQLSDEEIFETIKTTMMTFSNGEINEKNVSEYMKKLVNSGQYNVLAAKHLDEHTLNYVLGLSSIVE